MSVTRKFHEEMSLNGWVDMFDRIYFATKNHERTETQLLCRIYENAGNIGKFVHKDPTIEGIGKYLARTFAWYCALCICLKQKDMEHFVWHKFPFACAYCGGKPCECGTLKKPCSEEHLQSLRIDNDNIRPHTLDKFQEMFSQIYLHRNTKDQPLKPFKDAEFVLPLNQPIPFDQPQMLLAASFGRFVEELGEVTEAVRLKYFNEGNLRDELADIFAWMMGISNQLHSFKISSEPFLLSRFLWQYYPGYCRFCKSPRCICSGDPVEDVVTAAGIVISRHLDRLSGLGNREAWDDLCRMSEERPHSIRRSLPLSVLFIDIDDFDAFNKEAGHNQGDQIIIEVGSIIRATSVPKGQAFRLGERADEFCVIASNRSNSEAQIMAHELRTACSKHSFTNVNGGEFYKVTVSIGTATSESEAITLKNLLKSADDQMRVEKSAKRQDQG